MYTLLCSREWREPLTLRVCILLLLWTGSACADDAEIRRLNAYAGTYSTSEFLNDPAVAGELRIIAGGELEHVELNLNVTGPIDLISGWLTVSGNAPHQGTEEEAVVCMHPELKQVHAALFSDARFTVLTRADSYVQLPLCIKDWITLVESRHRNRLVQPANVRLQSPPVQR